MFGVPFAFNKLLIMARCLTNAGNPIGQNLDQAPTAIACDPSGILYTRTAAGPSNKTVSAFSSPGAGLVASATLPANAGHAYNAVLLTAQYGDTAAALPRMLVIRDGASGVGPIIWQTTMGPILAGDSKMLVVPWPVSFGIYGTAGNAMTAEFTAAPAATGFQSVSIDAYLSL